MGIEADYDYTPGVGRRIVFAATHGTSFQDASRVLSELADIHLPAKRIWRYAQRIGEEHVVGQQEAVAAYVKMPLPAQQQSPVANVPAVACVQMDGGRFQQRERDVSPASSPEASLSDQDSHWREFKAGCLLGMTSQVQAEDPCPQLPKTFVDPGRMREIAREIKGFTSDAASPIETEVEPPPVEDARGKRPEVKTRHVVATSGSVETFGPLLAAAAYQLGFHAAPRKAFVADGSSANWGIWRRFFSHYTPIVDFVHALMYVYAAAMDGRPAEQGWGLYREWAQWLWQGDVSRIIAALHGQWPSQCDSGQPPPVEADESQTATTLTYLINQQERMNYPEYRRQGLPITSSHIESTVKQINRRIKGTEKFWDGGADPMLRLVADHLSPCEVRSDYWQRRTADIIQTACYHTAG